MSDLGITSKIKFLGNIFFVWSIPVILIVLNIINQREIFNSNVLLGLFLGICINIIWKTIFSILDQHKSNLKNRQSFYKLI
jgi:glucan phosphoethanolaminetransferase (alkaline phosphatase superfamily)